MRAGAALAVAVVCGAFAIGLVAADTVWSLHARLDARDEGEWVTVAQSRGRYTVPVEQKVGTPGCYAPEFRVVLDNDKPLGDDVRVRAAWSATYANVEAADGDEFLDREVSLASFEEVTLDVTVPEEAFAQHDGQAPQRVDLTVRVDEFWFGACVVKEA